MKISIRQLTTAGVLGALMIVMGLVGTGAIPVPNLTGAMILMHIPIIIGAILEGPLVGFLLGIILAVFMQISYGQTFPFYVLIPARVLIGPVAWWVYSGVKKALENRKTVVNFLSSLAVILVVLIVVGAGFFAFNINPDLMTKIDTKVVPTGLTETQTAAFKAIQNQAIGLQQAASSLRSNGYMMLVLLGIMFLFVYFGMTMLLKQKSEQTAITLSAIAGTLTNSIITLGLGVIFPTALGATVQARMYSAAIALGTNTTIETVLAVTACVAVVPSIQTYLKFRDND